MSRSILVTGATGKQGGAVIDALLALPTTFDILALTRNPSSESSKALSAKYPAVKVIGGDLDEPASIFHSLSPKPWGVFALQLSMGPGATTEREVAQGKALIDASIANGVKHYVQASAARTGNPPVATPVPVLQTKHEIEKYLFEKTRGSDMTYTVLRPTVFFENLKFDNVEGPTFAAVMKYYIPASKAVPYISTADIGWFAADAFANPDKYKNLAFDLMGDAMTYSEFESRFKAKTGKPLPLPWGWWFMPFLLLNVLLPGLKPLYSFIATQVYSPFL
jgi:uncharacterized protein YbjT (DUF2867 family)